MNKHVLERKASYNKIKEFGTKKEIENVNYIVNKK